MPSKQQLDKAAWEWAESVEPEQLTNEHIETAYRVRLKPCKQNTCRRNCKGNPHCLVGLGERGWMQDIADSDWHEIDDPNTERRQKDSWVGLKNLGATCYVNSFLQVWYHNPAFRKAIYQWKPDDDPQELKARCDALENSDGPKKISVFSPSSVIGHLQFIFALLQFSSRRYIDPTPFITCLGLNATQQQDAQEFCKLFISLLEDKLSYQSNPVVRNIVQEQYSGEYAYVTRCQQCLTDSTRPSQFYELDLNIKGHKDVHECLGEFLQEEKLEGSNQYHCTRCQSKQNATRSIQLLKMPPVLNLQLLRFVFDRQTGCKKKLNSFIRFPEHLDMSKYLQKPENSVVYDLCAVLIHRGPSAYSGHYVAHIKDRVSGAWYKFNDETVEKMEGKKLHLGTEDNLASGDNNGVKPSKAPKLSKGNHASNNAYMLVYKIRDSDQEGEDLPPDNSDEWDLPEHLQEAVAEDNSKFEEWVVDLALMREQSVMSGKARQSEIRMLYEMLPSKEGSPYEFISTDWLIKWLNNDTGQIPEVDNSKYLCPHDKANPDMVVKMKCISSEAASKIYDTYGGGPRIGDALCKKCVEARCQLIHIKSRLQRENKIVSTLLKQKVNSDEEAFWIGKSSLRTWKQMVLRKYKVLEGSKSDIGGCDDIIENDDPVSSTEISSSGDCLDNTYMHNLSTVDEDSEVTSSFDFNDDILCEHKNLVVDENCRKLIQAELWKLLKAHFPAAPEFTRLASVCSLCQMQKFEDKQTRDRNRMLAQEQKGCLQDLYLDRNRPYWQKVEPNVTLYIVGSHFVDEWRKFARDPARREPVQEVMNACLLCPHRDLYYSPELSSEADPQNKLVLVWEHEWESISRLFVVDFVISARVVDENSGNPIIISSPPLCQSCHTARLWEEQQQLFEFTNAKIYVRRVSKLEEARANGFPESDYQDSQLETPFGGREDPEFIQNVKKKKIDIKSEVITGTDSQLRRSSRRRKLRGEKEITVSSNQTLRDLKLQIMKLFSVAPYDQTLTLNGMPLIDSQASLSSLQILPGSLVLLKADEPTEEAIVMEDYLKASAPETGFKGTELLKS